MKYVAVLLIGILSSVYVFVKSTSRHEKNGTSVLPSKPALLEPPVRVHVCYSNMIKEVFEKEDVGTLVSCPKTGELVVFLHPKLALEQPMFCFTRYSPLTAEKVYKADLVPQLVAKKRTS